jgi:hypothetical protein
MPQDHLTPRHHRDDLEARLRAALHARAHQATPDYRLDTILDEATAIRTGGRSGSTKWALALVAAACVLALALLVPGLIGGSPDASPVLPATTPTTSEPTPSETGTPTETPTETDATPTDGTPTDEPPATDPQLAALPVYVVAHIGGDLRMMRLYREWVNHPDVPRDAPAEARARTALAVALAANPPGTDGYLYTWDGVTVERVEVTDERITVTLSGPGPSDLDLSGPGQNGPDETARISVQQLVWTAQGAVGRGPIPVRFVVADGSDQLFGRLPTDRDYNRPASTDLYYEDLAPIWINRPTRGEVVDGSDVVVSGEATTFEGAFQWELISAADGSVLDSGFGQASAGAPARGTYEIGLGDLDPGEYAIRVFEMSMEDGTTVSAERTIPFTVR